MADPRLPPEVELLIFEHALQASIQDATNFFLVAHRVRECLLSKLPLTCISTDPAQLLTELAPSWPPSSVSPQSPAHIALKGIQPEPLFSGITHLEIIGVDAFVSRHLNQKLVLILHFPNLTHVALPVIGRPEISLTPDPVLFFLDHCRNLKALILIWSSGPIGLDHKGAEILPAEVRDDERLVVVRCLRLEDWKRGALGTGHNVWSFADMVLEQRRLVPDWRKTGQVRE
ncbi:hypothetical protein BDN72DRAFT_958513 [Pluteus cervinus]|uniref:Uncharacterized protein n=1 Tax=Pluteus cervinus TaxID=181527 RepID=A0ACD3B0X2_9AGAR|nr:hypothetical protein BDN72DRAFT_958513 [Pluteus cervinus]